MLAGGAGQEQLGRCLVGPHDEVKVPHLDFARAAAAAMTVRARLGELELEGIHVDFSLVFVIMGFALDAVDLEKIIRRTVPPVGLVDSPTDHRHRLRPSHRHRLRPAAILHTDFVADASPGVNVTLCGHAVLIV